MGEFGRQGHKIAQLAERQHGHVTRVQLLAMGLTSETIESWIAQGTLTRRQFTRAVNDARLAVICRTAISSACRR